MGAYRVQGGVTNATPQWTKKLGLPPVLTYKPPVSRTTEQFKIRHRLIIIDKQIPPTLDCCKDFLDSPHQKIK